MQLPQSNIPARSVKPEEIIENFVRERLAGNLEALKTVNLFSITRDEKYGCVVADENDPDDTLLMRAIYCVVFEVAWPELTMESLADYSYRGETLNTYNTMFGWKPWNAHYGLDRHNPTSEVLEAVMNFQRNVCASVGNMMVLPNKTVAIVHRVWDMVNCLCKDEIRDDTINCYRGCHESWHDFFDRFLYAMYLSVVEGVVPDKGLQRLLDANSELLSHIYGLEGWSGFIRNNILDDYVDSDLKPVVSSRGYYFWMPEVSDEDYNNESLRYVQFATEVINNRANKIIKRLKERL